MISGTSTQTNASGVTAPCILTSSANEINKSSRTLRMTTIELILLYSLTLQYLLLNLQINIDYVTEIYL